MHISPIPARFLSRLALAFGAALAGAGVVSAADQPAAETIDSIWQKYSGNPDLAWRDPTSHTRVVNLTSGFDTSSVFYFHQNIFTADGDLMIFSGKRGADDGYYVLSLRTGEIRQLTHQTGQHLVVLPRRRSAAFDRGDDVFLLNLDSGETRKVATVPHGVLAQGAGFGFTADEKKLLFAYCDQLADEHAALVKAKPQMEDPHLRRVDWVAAYEHMQRHNAIYSVDIDSGKVAVVFQDKDNNWLGHVQGSPTNPNLALFIHEGFVTVHIKNRLRLLDLATGQVTTPRTEPAQQTEGITHEFWDRDGESIWYDISSAGALAHLDVRTGVETRYSYGGVSLAPAAYGGVTATGINRSSNRSIHYAIGPDGKWAVGDGFQHTNPWLCIYRLDQRDPKTQEVPVVHICDFSGTYENPKAEYIEPNPHLTPDFRWVVFSGHLKGTANDVYAVEIPAAAIR
ncbi:MAG TPA: oligogalacturonate lyase family protein [Opitutaceae bacterium]|nr:oligogalacturonate lyase family protein [Opitutaceae bacterium]